MSVLTLRIKPEQEVILTNIQSATGLKQASKALLATAEAYLTQQREIEDLKAELNRTKLERDRYKKLIQEYQHAHISLIEAF